MFVKDLEVRVVKEGPDRDRVGIITRPADAEGRISVKFGGRGRPKFFVAEDLQATVLETETA
jgi:hypothetical protein